MPHDILLVDDERNIRLTLSRALEDMNLTVETTASGEEALERLREHSYRLVLLDLKLPGIDGMEVLRRMQAFAPETHVIVFTAHGAVESAVEAMKLGATDFIQKPFVPAEFRTAVDRALRKEAAPEAAEEHNKGTEDPARPAVPANKEDSIMEEKTLLVVDDERSIQLTLREALESAGYNVAVASSGEEALRMVAAGSYALVLLDLRLPGLDGLAVLRVLERDRPEIPVIVITAHGNVDTALEAMEIGAHGFVEKPFTPERIRTVVAHALDPGRQAAEAAMSYEQHLREAISALEARHLDAAVEHARRALSLDATRPEAFNLMGVFMQLRGELQAARRYFESALAIQPGYGPAQRNQANLAKSPSERNLGEYHIGWS